MNDSEHDTDGGDGGPDRPLFGQPMLVPSAHLKRSWDQLDQLLAELGDRDRYIAQLENQLTAARSGRPSPAPHPQPVGTRLDHVERTPIGWVWPGYLARGKITIVDGDPGLGKSTMLYDLAARITTGRAMPDGAATDAGGVLILSAEDGLADTMRPRLEAAGGALDRCLAVQTIPEADGPGRVPILPDDLAVLEPAARRVDARLMVIDPLMAHLGSTTNAYRDQDVRRVLAALSVFAEQCGLAVVVVRHLNKAAGGRALYRGGGSIGIIGAARVGLVVGRDVEDETRCVLACSKNNLSRLPSSLAFRVESAPSDASTSCIVWEGASPLSADDLLSGAAPRIPGAIEEAAAWLEAQLQAGPRAAATLIEEAGQVGIKKYALQRARRQLADTERVGGISGRGAWMWRLRRQGATLTVPEATPKVTPEVAAVSYNPETCHLSAGDP